MRRAETLCLNPLNRPRLLDKCLLRRGNVGKRGKEKFISTFFLSLWGNLNTEEAQLANLSVLKTDWFSHSDSRQQCWRVMFVKLKTKWLETTSVHAKVRCNFCLFYIQLISKDRTTFLSYNAVISIRLSFWMLCRWLETGADLPLVLGSLWSFFHFIRLFWNQILICLSERQRVWAISIRRRLVRYLLKWNSFSSSRTCCRV